MHGLRETLDALRKHTVAKKGYEEEGDKGWEFVYTALGLEEAKPVEGEPAPCYYEDEKAIEREFPRGARVKWTVEEREKWVDGDYHGLEKGPFEYTGTVVNYMIEKGWEPLDEKDTPFFYSKVYLSISVGGEEINKTTKTRPHHAVTYNRVTKIGVAPYLKAELKSECP